ncbi:hydantoinase/oxoprolinase family protein [Pseudonocardia dioxanivorans]|uniref:hydantoinase/oxoprolinase family protein n=1 Tax=Pseudonocardia dioxanivorans TaxID=240495 RepID=UPI000CD19CC2|nr:hydantoinase/oxoprolinase family protein [Pseudonocardia dioxanivorans]
MTTAVVQEDAVWCIGVDVGGTFTDVVLSDGARVRRAKAPSTPGELGRGVLDACRLVAERAGTTLEQLLPSVQRFGLGTTAVTNVIASRTGRRVGLLTTAGFEDLVPVARGIRTSDNGWLVPPVSLVEPADIVGVRERVDRSGTVLTKLEVADAVAAARRLVADHGIEALVVSFLWAAVNDGHERDAVAAIREALPDLPVSSAAALLPVVREYDRTQFALLNAYTSGALDGVEELARELAARGLPNDVLLVHSGGGSLSVAESRRAPATLAESGPAAGVVAALAACEAAGVTEAVVGDVGGTSYDVSLIVGGNPSRRTRGELMGVWTALPMLDIDSVGAGGGSLAWIDPLGILRVGPRSAGARPGPACYRRGGTEPTVTDALVVLGYIDPDRFLGGEMTLDREAAVEACGRLGAAMGVGPEQAAWGIWEVATASMVRALRSQFAERGLDPRAFTMVSVGGCGGLFAAALARELHIGRVLVPELASVFSAFGAAASDIRRERSRAAGLVLPADPEVLRSIVDRLTAEVTDDLAADGVAPGNAQVGVEAELRFHRQRFELAMEWSDDVGEDSQAALRDRFVGEYSRRYGKGALVSGAPVEVANVRVVGVGRTVRARLVPRPTEDDRDAIPSARRTIHRGNGYEPWDAGVVRHEDLRPGSIVTGPAIVEAADTTIWVPAGAAARMDAHRTLDIEVDR